MDSHCTNASETDLKEVSSFRVDVATVNNSTLVYINSYLKINENLCEQIRTQVKNQVEIMQVCNTITVAVGMDVDFDYGG